ncbi:Telomere repeat-binding protein 6 [Linum perenne]
MAHFDAFRAMTSSQVKVDDYLLPPPASRVDAHEVRPWHAVAEPRMENVPTDGLSWFHNESSWNNSGIEEFLRALDYNPIGGLGHYSTGGQDTLELGVLDDLLGGMHETDNFLAANEIYREYEGFLSKQGRFSSFHALLELLPSNILQSFSLQQFPSADIAAADKSFEASNHVVSEGSLLRNLSSASQSPGLGISNNVANYIGSAESTAGFLEAQLKTMICPQDMHGTRLDFQETAGYVALSNSECYDQENLSQIDTKPSASQGEDKKSVHCSCSPGWKISGKRSKRMIKKCSGAKSSDEERSKDTEEELLTGAVLQTLDESLPRRVPRKRQPVFVDLKPDDLYTSSESEDDDRKNKTLASKKTNDRRKHHVMWTATEVSKLVEGVTQYGIGRWTDIKKLHFSSSNHRTPIDLRDKWRNLVRACQDGKRKRWNQGVDQRPPSRRTLPEALMARVVELATIHIRSNNKK